MSAERWLPIPDWPGYMVSSEGRVRSHVREAAGVVMKLQRNPSNGYMTAGPTRDGKQKWIPVHVLVATAFHGPRPEGNLVRHLDGDKLNNRPDNLTWGTYAENAQDMVEHWGAHPSAIRAASVAECKNGHPFNDANSMPVTKKGGLVTGRRCRVCYWEGMLGVAERKLAAALAAIADHGSEHAA